VQGRLPWTHTSCTQNCLPSAGSPTHPVAMGSHQTCCTEWHGGVWLASYAGNQRGHRRPDRRRLVPAGHCEGSAATPADFIRAELTGRGQPALADGTLILTTARQEFGRCLRVERERRELTLQAIADSTKIPRSLLSALERGDFEDWPRGFFGRAHFRAYAAAVGLCSEQWMVEFLRLFDSDAAPTQSLGTLTPETGPRLTLAEDRRWGLSSTAMRALASAVDVSGIFTIATGLARILDADLSLACAVVGLTYYGLATLALGRSVTLWWLDGRVLQRTVRSNVRTGMVLVPGRRLRNSRRQQSPVDFRENPSAPVAQAASR
jgi:transcriptional regulator with XRE-family HTH domain